MRWAIPVVLVTAASASAQDRFVERAPLPRHPPEHTDARAGATMPVAPWAIPGVTRFEAGGYVGGGSLRGNRALARGPYTAPGPTQTGTFGWDFAGFRMRPGRVFLAASADPAAGPPVARNYRTDGPHVLDVFSLRPFRKAVLEKREVMEERKVGSGEH